MTNMKSKGKIIRLAWVTITNAIMLYETVPLLLPYRGNHPHISVWSVEGMLSAVVLVCGIAFEIRNSRIAKFLNIGFYVYRGLWGVFGVLAAASHVLGYTNESWIYFFLVSIPCFVVAIVNYFLYRERASAPTDQPVPTNSPV